MNYQNITVDILDGVATLSLNRPEKKNAMSPELHDEMLDALTKLEHDTNVHVLIITGKGDAFCAGQDLEKFFLATWNNPPKYHEIQNTVAKWGEILWRYPKPTIASVNGWCFGAGVRVMSLCDLAIASDKALFGLSEINFGIFPAAGATKAPSYLLPARDAMWMILTGDRISATDAVRMRLVNKVVPHESLHTETRILADKLKNKNTFALQAAKEVYKRVAFMDYVEAAQYELAKFHEMSYLQGDEWIKVALKQFEERKFKPGLDTYKRS